MILLLLLPPAAMVLVGLVTVSLARSPRAARTVGAVGMCAASTGGLGLAITALVLGDVSSLSIPWNAAIGASFSVAFDPLTGFFLLPVYGLAAVCAAFGGGDLSHAHRGRGLAAHWLFYGLLVASMALVVLARNAVLFLVAWEIMSLSSWQLVTFEHERVDTRQAGITYLVATQIGTAFLLVMFLLLGAGGQAGANGSLDFSNLAASGPAASAAFLLALVGFGTKAGIVPLHIWLPEAHPAAPSHVSALMSGVMIKTGIYGIVRVFSFIGAPPAWWGWTLVCIGAVSGVMGVLFALAQHDIKRLLAYHSVENIGIICLGLGVGLLGMSYGSPIVAFLGFAGGLLHVLNHALFKGLLFLGAGAASHAAGTREIDRLGGLLRRMPLTGAAFLVGAAAICGLPPLNGFISELLVFLGAYHAAAAGPAAQAAAAGIVVAALALIGGLAAACFAKAFGISFLGEPRTPAAAAAVEAGPSMTVPGHYPRRGVRRDRPPRFPRRVLPVSPCRGDRRHRSRRRRGAPGKHDRGIRQSDHGGGGCRSRDTLTGDPARSPALPPRGPERGNLGLRVHTAGCADAVHGLFLRGASHRHVPFPAGHAPTRDARLRAVPRESGVFQPHAGRLLTGSFQAGLCGNRGPPVPPALAPARPAAALRAVCRRDPARPSGLEAGVTRWIKPCSPSRNCVQPCSSRLFCRAS